MLGYHSHDTALPPSKDVLPVPSRPKAPGEDRSSVSVSTCPLVHLGCSAFMLQEYSLSLGKESPHWYVTYVHHQG